MHNHYTFERLSFRRIKKKQYYHHKAIIQSTQIQRKGDYLTYNRNAIWRIIDTITFLEVK